MTSMTRKTTLASLASLAAALLLAAPAFAGGTFAVESYTKYDQGATEYTAPSTVNFAVVKKGASDFVVWTRDALESDQLTAIEAYARAHDKSLQSRNAIFISGMGSHEIDTQYGTITFAHDGDGIAVIMPREWSHLDYGSYTRVAPDSDPDSDTGSMTITKTVDGHLWRVRCDYMDVDDQSTYGVQFFSGNAWKRDWIKNAAGVTSREGHRSNKCGDAEHWVIWTDMDRVAYRMDEIKSGSTGGTLPTVVYRTEAFLTDEEIANIGNPTRPECLEKYKQNFQTPMPYSEIRTGERLYWITFNGGQVWYHSGVPYEVEPSFVISIDGVPYILTGGQTVTIPDLEPGIHEISESEDPHYSLGTVVSSSGNVIETADDWTVKINVAPGEDVNVTWPNMKPDPSDPPTPPSPPGIDPNPPAPQVDTICELLDFGKRFNAVIFGSLLASGGDSEGALLVWGNATLPRGYTVGLSVVGDPTPAVADGEDALIVGGNLAIGRQDVNGNVVYGGDYLGEERLWNAYALRHVSPVTLGRSGNVPADGSGRSSSNLLAAAIEVSERVAAFETNGSVTNLVDGCLVLSGTNESRNVFSVTAEQWSGSQRDWIFDVPAGSKIVVNVTGAEVELENGRFVLPAGVTVEDVLVNYADATFLSFSGISHEGSVLAPYASGSFSGGAIEGVAILGGDVATKSGFEFHNFGLDVFFCPDMPEIVVTATAGTAADGDIFEAVTGSDVAVSVVVSNPTSFWLRSVAVSDSTGASFSLGDLAPSASATVMQVVSGDADGLVTYTATATASAYDGNRAFMDRPRVSAADVAVVSFVETLGAGSSSSGQGASSGNGGASSGSGGADPVYALADYAVEDMWFSCVPTFAGETFTVNVRIRNNGDAKGEGAFLGLYLVGVDHGATIESNEEIEPVRTVEMGSIPAGGSRVYSFGGLVTPDASGVCRVIAFADIDGVEREWSKGDNQNNLTYELSQVAIDIAVSADGVTLKWSNGWGQKYSILGSNDLENWDVVVPDIPSARDVSGLVENVETVGFETGYHFFKLRIDQR